MDEDEESCQFYLIMTREAHSGEKRKEHQLLFSSNYLRHLDRTFEHFKQIAF